MFDQNLKLNSLSLSQVQFNNQLEFITDNFILKLIRNIEKNFLAENSVECLMQFESFYNVGTQKIKSFEIN